MRISYKDAAKILEKGKRRKRKFNNQVVEINGQRFDSRWEAERFLALKNDPNVRDLQTQVSYDLTVNGHRICRYIADFVYQVSGQVVVEDAKGVETPVFRLKQKLMKAIHGIEILVSRKGST